MTPDACAPVSSGAPFAAWPIPYQISALGRVYDDRGNATRPQTRDARMVLTQEAFLPMTVWDDQTM